MKQMELEVILNLLHLTLQNYEKEKETKEIENQEERRKTKQKNRQERTGKI
jgi:hypothetical protein